MNPIIEEMKRQQGDTGTAPQVDPVIEQMKSMNQASHAQAAMAVSLSADTNPDEAARHAQLAKRYNTTPEVVANFPQEFKDRMVLEMARANLNNAPRLQDHINANPNTAGIIHDDLHNASAIEQTVRPMQYMSEWNPPEQGETIRERMSNYWRGLFGVQSVQEEKRAKREAEATAILAGRRGNPDLSENEAFEASRKAVGGMSPAAQIAAERFIDSATFGLVAPTTDTKARSWQQSVAGAGGQLAGFMVGPAKAANALINPLERAAGESFVKGFSKSVINEAATLALATAAEKSGHALLDSTSVNQGVETIGNALEGGAVMGATFGAAKKIFPDNTLPQWLARAAGVSAAQDIAEGTNPLDERVPLEDRLLKYFLNAAFTMHGGGRSEGGWLRDAAASKVAEQDFSQLSTLGQLSAASKWRERDPEGFKNFVRSTTEDGHLSTVYVDGQVFMQSLEKAGVSTTDLQKSMPEIAAQMKEALETKGYLQIPTEEYATHIAGGKLDAELLQHLKTDPEGKTYSEAQQFYQEQAENMKTAAADLVKEKTGADEFRASQQAVQDKIHSDLNAVGRFTPDVNRINATVQAALLSRIAAREGIKPEEAHAKYGASVVGEGQGGFTQITPEQAMRTRTPVKMPEHADFAAAVENTKGAEITPDGLRIDLQRHQKPEQSGEYSVRTGVFYLPRGDANAKHYRGSNDLGYGGAELHAGETLLRAPLFVKGATGGKAPEQAFIEIKGKDAFAEMTRAVTQVITGTSYMRPDPARKLQLIEEFLDNYAPELSARAAELESVSRKGNTLRYALQEAAVAHAVREAGYDSVVGYSKAKVGPRISEVFDVREQTYPAKGVESEVHPAFNQSAVEQTQTPEFKQWFGDSKIVDAEGKPLEMYHGTGKDFDTFQKQAGRQFFFSPDPEFASEYAESNGGNVIPAYIKATKVWDFNNPEDMAVLQKHLKLTDEEVELPQGFDEGEQYLAASNGDWSYIESRDFQKFLKQNGYDGFYVMDAGVKNLGVFEPNQIKSVFNKAPTNDASILKQDARGSYMPDSRTIALLKDADLSTYLHETGHWALDIYGRIAASENAPPEIKADMDKMLKWFGVESLEKWNSMSIDEQRPHHEQLARGFEAYFMEGKAPSAELAPVFARIRSWLVNIYKSLRNLNVELSNEVRGVFDRMLAADEAIAEAQAARVFEPLFKTKPEGMSDEEWRDYQNLGEQATVDAIADMQARSLRDMKWLSGAKSRALKALQKQAEGERSKIEAEVTTEVDQQPIYQVERWIKKGETLAPNGDVIQVAKEGLPGTKLNTEMIKEMFPEGSLGRPELEKLKGMTGPKGMDPDTMADMFGFRSGEELVRSLIDMEPRASVIEGLTDKRMLEEHGELATPAGLEAAANEAVHNDARAKFIATGLKVLAKSPIPARELLRGAKEAAEGAIAAKLVKNLNPRQYEAAESKANKEAIKLAAKDPAAAIQAQRASLLNNQLSKATRQAQEDVQKAIDHFKRLNKDAAQSNMRGEYLEQLNELLARFDLRTSVTNPEKNRVPLAEWIQAEADRLSAVVPDLPSWVLNEGYRTHYSELTVEQLRGLRDSVKQLEHMARREQKQYMAIRAMEFAAERGEVLDEIRKNWSKAFDEEGNPKGTEPDFVPSLKKSISKLGDKFAGEFLNPETILSILGGGKFTVINESLFGRLSSRSDWKAEKLAALHKEMKPLFDQYSVKEKYDFARKDIATPAGLDTPLTRENALVVALLHGNADGRERLANYGWSMEKQQQIINLLDAKDLNLANGIWRMFDHTLWPELKALNDHTRGKAPPKIEAVPYSTGAGEWTGGYFKLKYDTALDERAHRIDEGQAVKELLGGGFGMGAKTNQGSSTERKQDVRLRPRLDLGVFSEAVNETVHDLAYREAVADTMRMLNDKGLTAAVKQVVGTEGYRALVQRVREVAAPPRNPAGFVENTISIARRNTVINLMSGVKTALQNLTGLAPALAEINAGTLGGEIARFYSPKMAERYEFAMEQSAYMRSRFTNYDRDLQANIKKLTVNGSLRPDESTFLGLMGFIDKGVSVPVWNAAFKQGMGKFENDVSKSVDYADHIVRQTQGSGRDVDLAQIMSGHGGWGQLKKAFTMFYSYFNGQLNLLTKHAVIASLEAKEDPAVASAKMAAKFLAIIVMPTVLTELLMHGYTQDGESDEERTTRFAGAFIKYGAGMFPFVRDIVPGIWAQFTGDHYFGTKISPIDSAAEGVVKAAKSTGDYIKGEADERDTKNFIMGVGYLAGIPGKLISDTVDGTRAWLNGEAGPQAILLGPPPKR